MNPLLNQPLIWIPVLGIILAVLGVLCVLYPSYILAYVFKPEWIDARFRAYKSFYADLQVGMTRDEVNAALELHDPAEGPRQRLTVMRDTPTELGFFMNPEHSCEPNCEGIFLDLHQNHVTRKRYSAV